MVESFQIHNQNRRTYEYVYNMQDISLYSSSITPKMCSVSLVSALKSRDKKENKCANIVIKANSGMDD